MNFTIYLKFYALSRELTGCEETILEVESGATIRILKTTLWQKYPSLRQLTANCAWAVNHEYQSEDYVLSDKDEVVLIPPVSGG